MPSVTGTWLSHCKVRRASFFIGTIPARKQIPSCFLSGTCLKAVDQEFASPNFERLLGIGIGHRDGVQISKVATKSKFSSLFFSMCFRFVWGRAPRLLPPCAVPPIPLALFHVQQNYSIRCLFYVSKKHPYSYLVRP